MNPTSIDGISAALMRLVRENMFGGQELALIEPFQGPRPKYMYCSIGFQNARPMQRFVERWDKRGNDIYQILRGTRYCSYRLTFIGVGAYQKAVECQNWIKSVQGAEFTLAPVIGFGRVGEAQNITTENLAYQEERAFFNLDMYAKFSFELKWDEIDRVTGEFNRDGDDIPFGIDRNQ